MTGEEEEKATSDAKEAPTAMSGIAAVSNPTDPPLLVFLNTASGGQMGETVMEELGKLLPNSHIFNLKEAIKGQWVPEDKLKTFQGVQGVKVLICGGDGTMGWILSCIDRMPVSPASFPVAMMPLGTGNDLARSFGWGPGFAQSMLKPQFLQKVKKAPPSQLDRWLLSVMPYEPLGDDDKIKATHIPPTFSVHKYASAIGAPDPNREALGLLTTEARTQSVLRMGRSFSVRLSSIVKAVHEDEMNRSSSNGINRQPSTSGPIPFDNSANVRAPLSTTGQHMMRASSAPPVLKPGQTRSMENSHLLGISSGNMSPPLPTVGETGPIAHLRNNDLGAMITPALIPAASGAGEEKKEEEADMPAERFGEQAAIGVQEGGKGNSKEAEVGDGDVQSTRSREVAVQTEKEYASRAASGTGNAGAGDGGASSGGVQAAGESKRPGPPRPMPSFSVIQKYETWESYDAVFCNYFSFGVDAVAASAFHAHRKQHPELFTSRCRNQMWYARKGFPAAGGVPCGSNEPPPFVKHYLSLRVRPHADAEWESVDLYNGLRGVVVLNLQSYGGGRNLWGAAEASCSSVQYPKATPDDKLLEIVGIASIFKLGCIMGLNKAGVRGHRLCQAAEVELRIRTPIHMQIDGEPWLQAPAKINIQHFGQSTCLRGM